ncbi:hypothetical protein METBISCDRAFT_16657 [Metschnikowia bicuspidata]|uniref:Tyrosine specific protein phosphatases domain-containing protein n=1 Tax=Metschnikowia bicuspidata TaxID=27322 RepID=A0A4P9ZBQ0_9ASCO|nr:hypothetical protein METBISCDRAFT_16657 [Metschnikowia bicuspidata]
MDPIVSEDFYSGLNEVPPPREFEICTPSGVKGTVAVPHAADQPDHSRHNYLPPTNKIALILHGQGGHRNYCYQKHLAHKLAAELGYYSVRIDFRGCGDLADVANPKGRVLELDLEDIDAVVNIILGPSRLIEGRSLVLLAIISHSRGAVAMFLWAEKQHQLLQDPETAAKAVIVPNLVNCSLRFRSHTVYDRYPVLDDDFEYIEQLALRHGKIQKVKVTRDELVSLGTADLHVLRELPPEWSVLSIYGAQDEIIPKEDCALFANTLNRGRYTHHLQIIDSADHNYYGLNVIENNADMEEYNPHNLPLTKKKLVNYNPAVSAIIIKYLRWDQELLRFASRCATMDSGVPRFKNVEGIANFRDIGGWEIRSPTFPTGEHAKIKYHVRRDFIFRCANTATVTDNGLRALKDLGTQRIFDLRSLEECKSEVAPDGLQKVGHVSVPVFSTGFYSPEQMANRFTSLLTSWHTFAHAYGHMLEEGALLFRAMFTHVCDHPDQPFLFHCTAGKDRTGVFGMLLLSLAGVDRDTIAKEYALTTYGLRPDHEVIRRKFLSGLTKLNNAPTGDQLRNNIIQGRQNWKIEEEGFENLISSRPEAALATLELLELKYNGIVAYMKQRLGFSQNDVETIFRNIVCTSARSEPSILARVGASKF